MEYVSCLFPLIDPDFQLDCSIIMFLRTGSKVAHECFYRNFVSNYTATTFRFVSDILHGQGQLLSLNSINLSLL